MVETLDVRDPTLFKVDVVFGRLRATDLPQPRSGHPLHIDRNLERPLRSWANPPQNVLDDGRYATPRRVIAERTLAEVGDPPKPRFQFPREAFRAAPEDR